MSTRHAVWVPLFDPLADPLVAARLAAEAEAAGWDGFFVWDHVRWNAPIRAVADPWITLAAIAAGTERLRIGPMVTPLARRRPAKVARETATLDRLAGGRLTLGVGLGGDRYGGELSRLGEQTDDRVRGQMLDEALGILAAAWSGEPVRHRGAHYLVDDVAFLPRPVQRPAVPVWVAAYPGSRKPLRRAARFQGFFPIGLERAEQLAEALALIGAPQPYDVAVALPSGEDPALYLGAGATWLLTDFDQDTLSLDHVRGVVRDGPCQESCQGRGGPVSGGPPIVVGMTTTAIEVSGLRKAFGDKTVLDGIDLEVRAGSVYSLLGPNGAGKTTTVNVLTTLIRPDGGTVRVAGFDAATQTKQVRASIGVTGQFAAVDELLSGRENLQLVADLKRVRGGERLITGLLERFDLAGAASQLVMTYSGGMRRKLDLAMTLVGSPRIIFLDEPTTGLDPRSRRTMWSIVRELVADGVTIFLTTQYLEEADQLADRIAVLDHGRLVAEGTAAELKRQVPGGHVRLRFADAAGLDAAARVLAGATRDDQDLTLNVPGDGDVRSLRAVLDRLDAHAIGIEEFSVHTPDLDDVFLALTGRANTEVSAK